MPCDWQAWKNSGVCGLCGEGAPCLVPREESQQFALSARIPKYHLVLYVLVFRLISVLNGNKTRVLIKGLGKF